MYVQVVRLLLSTTTRLPRNTCHYLQRITLDGFCMSNKATTIINNNSNKVREIKYVYF